MVTPCRLDMQGTDWIDVGEADDVSGRLVLKGVDGDVWW